MGQSKMPEVLVSSHPITSQLSSEAHWMKEHMANNLICLAVKKSLSRLNKIKQHLGHCPPPPMIHIGGSAF